MGSGHGTMTWLDGVEYVGQFKMNKRDGMGKMVWPTGRWKSYDGQWKTNTQHGQGTLISRQDEEHEGVFEVGKLVTWKKAKPKAKATSARKAGLQAAARASDGDLADVMLFSADEEEDCQVDNANPQGGGASPRKSAEASGDLRLMALLDTLEEARAPPEA